MLLRVDHETGYRYDRPVRGVVQCHRLTPSVCDVVAGRGMAVVVAVEDDPGGTSSTGGGAARRPEGARVAAELCIPFT